MSSSTGLESFILPLPGFRFRPTDEELLSFYLVRKVQCKLLQADIIPQLDIYKYDPWELPSTLGDNEHVFFCQRDRKYRNSNRPNRVTKAGFWKATGCDRSVCGANTSTCIGLKKSLVFYKGRASKASKTDWMMHELRLPVRNSQSVDEETWAVCRIFKKRTPLKNREAMVLNCGQTLRPHSSSSSSSSDCKMNTIADDVAADAAAAASFRDEVLPLLTELESSQSLSLDGVFSD